MTVVICSFLSFSYDIQDMQYEGAYLVSANFSTCFEARAPCAHEIVFLDNVFLSKKTCDWDLGFYQTGTTGLCFYVSFIISLVKQWRFALIYYKIYRTLYKYSEF